MATLVISTRTDRESYTQQVELDDVVFTFTFAWNTRDLAWYFSIADADGVSIADGIRLVVDTPLLRSVSNASKPEGTLMAVDTSGAGSEAGLQDLGDRVVLMYEEAS